MGTKCRLSKRRITERSSKLLNVKYFKASTDTKRGLVQNVDCYKTSTAKRRLLQNVEIKKLRLHVDNYKCCLIKQCYIILG